MVFYSLDVKLIARFVLLALVLIIVAMISALTAMQFAIHGHEVTVPNLVGMSVADAERASSGSGLALQVERQYYSPTVAVGKIMSQVPDAGTKVRRGWQLRVAQSLGPQRIAIPDLTGETSRAAQLNIERRGLELGATSVIATSGAQPDQVIAQSPPANASGVAAPRISLLLSVAAAPASYVMPNLVGQSLGSATQILQSAGMRVGTVKITGAASNAAPPATNPASGSDETPAVTSMILSQEPAAGQKIIAGSSVNFDVSR